MKNAINYFYNIIVDNIHQNEEYYYFDYDNERYILIAYFDDPNVLTDIYNLHLDILRNGGYVHQIILNKDNNIATIINGTPFVLMKARHYAGKINFNTILSFLNVNVYNNLNVLLPNNYDLFIRRRVDNQKSSMLERGNLGELWSNKNDYLEYQISQLGQKYQVLRDSFSYYIGLGETAIAVVNSVSKNMIKTVSHRRIKCDDDVLDFYNPLNLIIDGRVRDIAEYLKISFFSGNNITDDFNSFFIRTSLTRDEHLVFFARMLYPTYYYDLFEEVISGRKSDNDIKKITALSSNYEIFLRNLYKYYRKTINIEPIEWLE